MNYTIEKIKKIFVKKDYRFFDGIYNLNIIGVRSPTMKSNRFDDLLLVVYRNENLQWVIKQYVVTTDPGKNYLTSPLDKNGTIIMVPGQYPGAYAIGIHGRSKRLTRQYEALEQVKPMCYVRDNNRDDLLNFELMDNPKNHIWGIFKTNIHRAGSWWHRKLRQIFPVGPNGAGCQVHEYSDAFEEMMGLARKARARYGNSFTYTLLKQSDFS
ncbi:MAG TPA: hypothetical protein VFO70_09650 [Chitinophagaceae bacterium]|nr:hypothetical protein [Chitinophagaceae bacterium]